MLLAVAASNSLCRRSVPSQLKVRPHNSMESKKLKLPDKLQAKFHSNFTRAKKRNKFINSMFFCSYFLLLLSKLLHLFLSKMLSRYFFKAKMPSKFFSFSWPNFSTIIAEKLCRELQQKKEKDDSPKNC